MMELRLSFKETKKVTLKDAIETTIFLPLMYGIVIGRLIKKLLPKIDATKAVQEVRKKDWNKAIKKAKGDIKKASEYYMDCPENKGG